MDFRDIIKALESVFESEGQPPKTEQAVEGGGVMTDVGPQNARAYSAILAGKEAAEPPAASTLYPSILPRGQAAQEPILAEAVPGGRPTLQGESILAMAPSPLESASRIAGMGMEPPPKPEGPPPRVPTYLRELTDKELRKLVNDLYGVKANRPGAVSRALPREQLLEKAAETMGVLGPKEPVPAPPRPPVPQILGQPPEFAAAPPVPEAIAQRPQLAVPPTVPQTLLQPADIVSAMPGMIRPAPQPPGAPPSPRPSTGVQPPAAPTPAAPPPPRPTAPPPVPPALPEGPRPPVPSTLTPPPALPAFAKPRRPTAPQPAIPALPEASRPLPPATIIPTIAPAVPTAAAPVQPPVPQYQTITQPIVPPSLQHPPILAAAGQPLAPAAALPPPLAPLRPGLTTESTVASGAVPRAGGRLQYPAILSRPPRAIQSRLAAPAPASPPQAPESLLASMGQMTGPAALRPAEPILAMPPGPRDVPQAAALAYPSILQQQGSRAAVQPEGQPGLQAAPGSRLAGLQPAPPPPQPKTVQEDVRRLTWAERHQRLTESGRLLPESDVAAQLLTKHPTRRQIVTESERQEQRERDRQTAQERARWEASERKKAEVLRTTELERQGRQGFGPGAPATAAGGTAGPQGGQPGEGRSELVAAIKRLTEAMQRAAEPGKTVAQEVAGMSWGERLARLEKSGGLLSEESVKAATLKETLSPRDVIQESERQEQRKRDAEYQTRQKGVLEARGGVAHAVGGSVGNLVSRLAGPTIGAAVAQGVERMAHPLVTSLASRLAGRAGVAAAGSGVGGAAAAGAAGGAGGAGAAGGIIARIGGAAGAHPVAALATAAVAVSIAFWKIPGAVQRLTSSLLEGQRELGRYSAAHQALFAQLDYQKRLLAIKQAQETAGSATFTGGQYKSLMDETQELREFFGTMKNLLGGALTFGARAVNAFIKANPLLWGLMKAAEKLEEALRKPVQNPPLFSYLDALADRGAPKPKNRKPGGGREND